MNLYFFNGKFLNAKDVFLHISDLSILRGYGVFDYFPIFNGNAFHLKDYLARFYRSSQILQLEIPYSKTETEDIIRQLIRKNKLGNGAMKLIITGGYSKDGYTIFQKPNFAILVQPPPDPDPNYYKHGANLILHEYLREIPYVKTTNYISSIYLRKQMEIQKAVDVLYHYQSNILETSRANFFLVKNNTLITAKDQILEGITRKYVLEIAKDIFDIEIRNIKIEEIEKADEAFITSSGKKVMPIVKVVDKIIGDGTVGPQTKHLIKQFENFISSQKKLT